MNLETILDELRQQSDRIASAISALVGHNRHSSPRGPGRPAGSKNTAAASKPKRRRTMSASARAKISAAQKARWAKQKKGKNTARKQSTRRRTMSPAARKKLSALMKARWAARKTV